MLLRRTPSGRRSAVTAASAAALCLASALTACGGGGGGYTAVGAMGTGPGTPGPSSGPTGSVTLVPLDGSPAGTPHGSAGAAGGPAAGTTGAPTGPAVTATSPEAASPGHGGTGDRRSDAPAPHGPAPHAPAPDPSRPAPSSPAPTSPAAPADLTWSAPVREATDKRWCEKVTVGFRNTGGTAVRSGTITLGTHIIGALGVDWATITSTRPLPVPVAPGSRGSGTWTVCVDDWRVPLGMHVETRIVTVDWS
ncbi:hypothetical protein ACWC4D_14290 [Streptomyces sp. NPDC001288]|uniref:hypothetical protein n=1 Tax=unclassified Streptomyces TaxID=2593676 RepID=UPI00331E3BBA